MFFISPVDLVIVLAAVGFGGFYCWAQQQGLLIAGQGAAGEPGPRRISLLTEAGVFAAAAVFFLLAGLIVRQVREPAISG